MKCTRGGIPGRLRRYSLEPRDSWSRLPCHIESTLICTPSLALVLGSSWLRVRHNTPTLYTSSRLTAGVPPVVQVQKTRELLLQSLSNLRKNKPTKGGGRGDQRGEHVEGNTGGCHTVIVCRFSSHTSVLTVWRAPSGSTVTSRRQPMNTLRPHL